MPNTSEDTQKKLTKIVEDFIQELLVILQGLKNIESVRVLDTPAINLEVFFDKIRGPKSPLYKRINQSQVDGHKFLLEKLKNYKIPLSWAAYILATVYHETARTMQPVREGLGASDQWRKKNLRYYPWYGRGYVQLTWKDNYEKADKLLGLNGELLGNPDRAMDPNISADILIRGMLKGWFSRDMKGNRHTLERHIKNKKEATFEEFKNARRIVNLMDKADLIASYAIVYQEALTAANYPQH